jgi:hypothetical protein
MSFKAAPDRLVEEVHPSTQKNAAPVHSIKFIHNRDTVRQFDTVAFDTTLHSLKFTAADLHFDFVSLVMMVQLEQRKKSRYDQVFLTI